jgi:hypothetical protein
MGDVDEMTELDADTQMEALFHTLNSEWISSIVAMGVGAAGIASGAAMGPAAGAILGATRRTALPPHWILIGVNSKSIRLTSSSRKGEHGALLSEYRAGSFRATLARNIGEVDLVLFAKGHESVALKGKWGPFHRSQIRVARAVVALAAN